MYGQTLVEVVQGPGEVIFLPERLTHCILNLHDNVAYTENYLYVGGISGKLKNSGHFHITGHPIYEFVDYARKKIN